MIVDTFVLLIFAFPRGYVEMCVLSRSFSLASLYLAGLLTTINFFSHTQNLSFFFVSDKTRRLINISGFFGRLLHAVMILSDLWQQ